MSARSLSLKAYLAYARGGGDAPEPPERPPGLLIWALAGSLAQARALHSLGERLRAQRPEVSIMVCLEDSADHTALPPDTQRATESYVRALRPDVVLWASNQLRPALLDAFAQAGIWLVALDIRDTGFRVAAPRWLPDPVAATLALFDRLYAVSDPGARMLRRLGVAGDRIAAPGPLSDAAPPLDCSDALHGEVAETLTGRPVWLAAHLRADETSDILRAHRQATRLAHRLLLIIAPATAQDGRAITAMIEASGLRWLDWDSGDFPEEATQILLAPDGSELGLWYRLAPLAFMGSSLNAGHGGSDPFEAAALGTAILYGPNVGQHLTAYTQLVEAGGARIVRDADSLGAAVQHLIAPDKSAAMAHAGWDVISAGAQLVDTLMTDIGQHLDTVEAARGLE